MKKRLPFLVGPVETREWLDAIRPFVDRVMAEPPEPIFPPREEREAPAEKKKVVKKKFMKKGAKKR